MSTALMILVGGLTVSISMALTYIVVIPLYGALVRYRANYTPRGIALDGEGSVQPLVGPVVTGYFQMLFRVKRLEGIAGLYKGTMPIIINDLIAWVLVALWMGSVYLLQDKGEDSSPVDGSRLLGNPTLFIVYASLVSTVQLPLNVIINRAIATRYKLPAWNIRASLAVLLSPYEQSRPWTLFFIPGLLTAQVAHVLWRLLVLHLCRTWLIPSSFHINSFMDSLMDFKSDGPEWPEDFTPLRISLYASVLILSTFVLCPLEVMATRLSLQRNYSRSAGVDLVVTPQNGDEDHALFASAGEEVLGVRPEGDQYVGFVDCAKRMAAEEGVRVLYRGWWITLLGGSSTLH